MLFSKGEMLSAQALMSGVGKFSSMSGLMVNMEKSACFFGNVDTHTVNTILSNTGFSRGFFPVTYLGLPLITSKLHFRDCMPLVLRMCKKFDSWTCYFLSYAGRHQLLKTVMFGIQGYWAAHLFLPQYIIKKIQSLCVKFLWGGKHSSACQVKVSWKECCSPKEEGGLGIRDL